MQITQGLRRAVQVNGAGVATIFKDRRRTYKEFAARVAKLAGAIAALGAGPGDRVAILALNSDRYLEYYFAGLQAGAVIVPLNTRWAAPEIIFSLNDSESSILFIDDAFTALQERITAECPNLRAFVYMDDGVTPSTMHDYEKILEQADALADAGRGGDDLAGIFYTGGTTGRSKGVMLSHRNVFFNAVNITATVQIDPDTHWLHAAPMFHLADGVGTLGVTMLGGTHSFVPSFAPEPVLRVIQDNKVNFCLFVPTMINMLVNHPNLSGFDVTSVKRCIYGASPMPESVVRLAMERLPTWQFIHGYGMTELSPFTTALPWEQHLGDENNPSRMASCGRAALGCEVRVVGSDGDELPAGEIGEIIVRGDNVMLGYWRRPEETAAALRNGWMWTGDAAYMDDEGYFFIVDRVKDMIITGGENVYSAEVEQAVYQHAAVLECAVIGVPDEKWGERVHAIVRLREGSTTSPEEIISHCHELIGGFKCPRSVSFRDQAMPLSGAGKILKTELRAPYWENRKLNVS